ncbi:MAG: RNA polymerase sigma factor [Ruminococcaceae bacterium]|nr:RNA polymerase sigma factor [Oscillospiraceae bacterium]
MVDPAILEKYTDSVYGYALRRTYTRDEADELSQEILLTALRSLPTLRDESRLDGWFWGVAENVTRTFRRYQGRRRAMYAFDVPEMWVDSIAEMEEKHEYEELCARLRMRITRLSALYRDILILYYYDGLSTKQIAHRLEIPEGTVTWRLAEGRRKLKKECETMNETALHPVKMKLDIYGSGDYGFQNIPFPYEYISDALSQNVLYHAYEKPRSAEELADLCGVPAYYIEDCLANLKKRNAVITTPGGKVQTDFVIWTDKYAIFFEENLPGAAAPVADRMCEAIRVLARDAQQIPFWRAEKSEAEMLYLCGMLAFQYLEKKLCVLPYPPIPLNYDGFPWRYIADMGSGKHRRGGTGIQCSANLGSRGSYAHYVFTYTGFRFRKMMLDTHINVCEDLLHTGRTAFAEDAAAAIENGNIIRREDGTLFVPVPAFTREQKQALDALTDTYLMPLAGEFSENVKRFADGYGKLFPKHLFDDACRLSRGCIGAFYEYFCIWGREKGILPQIPPDSVCEVLIQHEK